MSVRRPADGFDWDGGAAVRVYRGPGWAVPSAGGLVPWLRSRRLGVEHLALVLPASFVVALLSEPIYHLIFLAQLAYLTLVLVERYAPRPRAGLLHRLAWNERQVVLDGPRGARAIAPAAIARVVWKPVHWHGAWTRRAMALGAEVGLELRSGEWIPAGSGFDTCRLRQLAERLGCDLGLDMVERFDTPIVRAPHQLNAPITARLNQLDRHWQRMPSYSGWKVQPTPAGYELRLAGDNWRAAVIAAVASEAGEWLFNLVLFELLRLPALVWLALMSTVVGPLPASALGGVDALDCLMLAAACVPLAHKAYRAARGRVLRVDGVRLTYEVAGRVVATLPIEQLEQVRLERFPRLAVRLVSDQREILIDDLPKPVDYEALADQLPHLVPKPPEASAS